MPSENFLGFVSLLRIHQNHRPTFLDLLLEVLALGPGDAPIHKSAQESSSGRARENSRKGAQGQDGAETGNGQSPGGSQQCGAGAHSGAYRYAGGQGVTLSDSVLATTGVFGHERYLLVLKPVPFERMNGVFRCLDVLEGGNHFTHGKLSPFVLQEELAADRDRLCEEHLPKSGGHLSRCRLEDTVTRDTPALRRAG